MNEEQKYYFRCGQAYTKAIRFYIDIDDALEKLDNDKDLELYETFQTIKRGFGDIIFFLNPAKGEE